MKHLPAFLAAGLLLAALPLRAQTIMWTEDFSNSKKWNNYIDDLNDAASLTEDSNRLVYTNTSPSSGASEDINIWTSKPTLSIDSSWNVQVSVHADSATTGSDRIELLFGLYKSSASPNASNLVTIDNISFGREGGATSLSNEIWGTTSNVKIDKTETSGLSLTDVTLALSYDNTTGILTSYYSTGSGWAQLESDNIVSDWGLTASDTLSLLLGASDSGVTVASGSEYFSNLVGTTGTVVPEPSTAAAVAGGLALAVALWRRRR